MNFQDFFFKYLWVVTLILIFGVCYFTAGTLNAYLASKYLIGSLSPPSALAKVNAPAVAGADYRPNREGVVKRNLFSMIIASAEPGQGENAPAAETSLQAKLLGVIFFGSGASWNRATLKLLQDNKNEVFKEGDVIKETIVVSAIEEKLMRVRYQSGREEEFSLEEKPFQLAGVLSEKDSYKPGIADVPPDERERRLTEYRKAMGVDNRVRQVSDREFIIEQAAINDALQNLNTLLQQARLVPNLVGEGENKTADGFRIFRIRPDSLFNNLGIRNGDVIKAINGVKMDNIERGFELLQQLRFEKHFTLDIGRQDQAFTINYSVQ